MTALTVLVAVHEAGHYLTARMFGMHVNAFAVMMGGVRKTDLRPFMREKLVPGSWLTVFGLVSFAALFGGVVGVALYLLFQDLGVWPLMLLSAAWGATAFPLYAISVAHANDNAAADEYVQVSSGLLLMYGIGAVAGPFLAMGQAYTTLEVNNIAAGVDADGTLFNDRTDVEGITRIAAAHRQFGTTGMLPTLISDDLDVVDPQRPH